MAQQIAKEEIIEISEEVFGLFCADISAMFDVGVKIDLAEKSSDGIKELKKRFKNLCCVWVFNSKGSIDKDFYVFVDQKGLFTLGGTFVMHPEQIIVKNRNHGGKEESRDIADAVGEVGNLLSGTFERYLRDNYEEHGHLKQTDTLIDSFAANAKTLNIDDEQGLEIIDFEMQVEPFEPFAVSIIYPPERLEVEEEDSAESESAEEAKPEAAVEAQASKTEEKAQEETQDKTQKKGQENTQVAEQSQQQEKTEPVEKSPVSSAIKDLVENNGGSFSEIASSIMVKDVINSNVVYSESEKSIEHVLDLMQNNCVDYVLVGDSEKLEGVVSINDINSGMSPFLKPVFSKLKRQQDIATLKFKVKWLMSQPIYSVSAESSLKDAVKVMHDNKIGFVPVKDKEGKVIGSISFKEIMMLLLA